MYEVVDGVPAPLSWTVRAGQYRATNFPNGFPPYSMQEGRPVGGNIWELLGGGALAPLGIADDTGCRPARARGRR